MSKDVISKEKILEEEYLKNQKQIECISNVLVEHADVPKKLIDWLIEAVRNNTKIECKKNL